MDESTLLDYLARTEKFRWNAEKVMDGWRAPANEKEASADKDPQRMIHPSLVAFDDLSKEEQQKDAEVVKKIFK